MDLTEYEATLADLETRLDRLKVLYEQWFQGLERLEPSIPRKEVDRRFYLMRKEQVRNTALRFRFQQLVQRYTTYITYWGRVARQIEEGTYRRDVMKLRQTRQDYRARMKGDRAYEIDIDVDPMEDSLPPEADVDAALAAFEAAAETSERARAPMPTPPVGPPVPPGPSTTQRPMLSPFAFGRPLGGSAPVTVSPPHAGGEPLTATFGRPARSDAPTSALAKVPRDPKTADIPTTTFARAAAQASQNDAPSSSAPTRPLVAPARTVGTPTATPPAAPRVAPTAAAPTPTAPGSASTGRAPVQPPISPLGAPRAPMAPPSPSAPQRPFVPTPAAAAPARDVSDDQIRAVFDRYVDARRKNNERTDNVRYETLAKSLREMVPKLREKHAGKAIDFEVVVKDGKVGIKPVPKG